MCHLKGKGELMLINLYLYLFIFIFIYLYLYIFIFGGMRTTSCMQLILDFRFYMYFKHYELVP